ncbi:1719_t:CDS:2 [Paraglomus occultum]|uniref:1719_t:CDS:1 n=1 Tax=Paraglomus occultum TaxID=144539 RepID=A0A9N9C333_9GLOM|nr:1719_t:CDS:2 [Paraglomus occultum]
MENHDYNVQETVAFPIARVKRIIKQDEDVKACAADATLLIAAAAELFVEFVVKQSLQEARNDKRKTVSFRDISSAIESTDELQFLDDLQMEEDETYLDAVEIDSDKDEINEDEISADENEINAGEDEDNEGLDVTTSDVDEDMIFEELNTEMNTEQVGESNVNDHSAEDER